MIASPWPDLTNDPYDVMPDDEYEAARIAHAEREKRHENFGQIEWARKIKRRQRESTAPPPPNAPANWKPPAAPNAFENTIADQVLEAHAVGKTAKAHKPGGDANGAKRKAERQAKVDYCAAFLDWWNNGHSMADFQQDHGGNIKRNIEHVQRGADVADFAGMHADAVAHVRSKRGVGWHDPRTRRPDPATASSKRHNDWLRELRDNKYAAAKPTDE